MPSNKLYQLNMHVRINCGSKQIKGLFGWVENREEKKKGNEDKKKKKNFQFFVWGEKK